MDINQPKKKKINRFIGLLVVMVMVFGLLISEMVNLQVIHGAEYYNRANVEFIKNIDTQSPRGEILDNQGRVLATSAQSYNLIYVDTLEGRKVLYQTMDKVRELLAQTGQEMNDSFALKSQPYRWEFGSDDEEYIKKKELRWKKDRGINDYLFLKIMRKETGKDKIKDLDEPETDRLDELILAFTPEETNYYLMEFYNLYEALNPTKEEKAAFKAAGGKAIYEALLEKFDEETIRSYLILRDNIKVESYSGSKAVTLVRNMTEESAFIFLQQLSLLPGIDVETDPIRIYPYETLASHVIGYLNPIPEKNKEIYEEKGYDISKDTIGITGIESAFEERLKGSKGVRTVEVDKNGRPTRELFELEPYPGNSIKLTLDANLQNTAEMALEDMIINLSQENTKHSVAGYTQDSSNATRGAVVALEVNTGNVLAMASYPKYDPNVFAVPGKLTDELITEFFRPDYLAFGEKLIQQKNVIMQDPITKVNRKATAEELFPLNSDGVVSDVKYDLYAKPLYNYATQGLAPSGSTFKIITGLAALEEGVVTPSTIIRDRGAYVNDQIGTPITNEGGGSYGDTDLAKAIAKSSNVFFADMGYRLYKAKGLNAIAEWAWKLGLGHSPDEPSHSTTGIEIEENRGDVYNHLKKVELTKNLFMFDVVNFLKTGKSRVNRERRFQPLDIEKNDADLDAIKQAKIEIKDVIKKSLDISLEDANKGIKKNINTVIAELDVVFEKYLHLLPEEEQSKLSSSKTYADEIATKIIFDQSTELLTPRNVLNSALGQGDNQLTLLQIANALGTVVNGGTRYKTNLIQQIIDPDGNITKQYVPTVLEDTGIKASSVAALKKGLFDATQPGGGVHSIFKDFPINSGGKTGTATWKTNQEEFGRAAFGVYTGVAPIDNPEIVVAVIIYDATRGSFVAPVSLAVFEEYFEERLKTEYPSYVRQYDYQMPEPKNLEVNNETGSVDLGPVEGKEDQLVKP